MKAGVGKRVKQVRSYFGVSQTIFGKWAGGLSKSAVSQWENDGTLPERDALTNLRIKKMINPDWIMDEIGEMLLPDEYSQLSTSMGHVISDMINPTTEQATTHTALPIYDIEASAGKGAFVNNEQVIDSLTVTNDFLAQEIGVTPGHLAIIYVRGDSMSPSLNPGDLILVDRTPFEKIMHEGLYVFMLDDNLMVKHLQRLPKGRVRVTSVNATTYPAYEINLKDHPEFSVLGKVVWTWCGKRY